MLLVVRQIHAFSDAEDGGPLLNHRPFGKLLAPQHIQPSGTESTLRIEVVLRASQMKLLFSDAQQLGRNSAPQIVKDDLYVQFHRWIAASHSKWSTVYSIILP